MDELLELELLGLVDKVASELQNHLGVHDKALAEFIIAQRVASDTSETFRQKVCEIGSDTFSSSLIDTIDRFVCLMHPAFKANNKAAQQVEHEEQRSSANEKGQVFPGVALLDGASRARHPIGDAMVALEAPRPKGTEGKIWTQKRNGNRSRSPRRSPTPEARPRGRGAPTRDLEPVLHKIYDGRVTSIKDFGAFVSLHGVEGKADGLVHISRLANERICHPSDVVQLRQAVKVKVVSVEGTRIGLSIKDVDQDTGYDIASQPAFRFGANMESLGGGRNEHNDSAPRGIDHAPQRQKKRMTSPERWEMRQLVASGVVKASDFPDLEEEYHATLGGGNNAVALEEDVDIEVREEEPPFLAGQTKLSLELSPIRVIKVPEGSLNRAIQSSTVLLKERRELKQEAAEATTDSKEDKRGLWARRDDPMADPDESKFAIDRTSDDVPEWNCAARPQDNKTLVKRSSLTIRQQRESFPVFAFRDRLIEAVRQYPILIVVGETGSGKTTQITQYLAEAGFADRGIIGCTQPRRVAAISVAKRVAEEVGCVLGQEVGYTIRFEDCTSPATKLKYMTDGMLQREILLDPDLKRYSVIMLDEAHERTIATDVLFGLLKRTLKKRPDLKIIVTSATLDADKFSTYFYDAPIFRIPGRTFPVEILYSREPESDYLDATLVTVMQIHLTEPAGDILLFLTGQEEIDTFCEVLHGRVKGLGSSVPELLILPVYSALPAEMQSSIFEPAPPGTRKVVVATNIAETSITIDQILYVVDPGFVKQKAYDPKLGMDSLIVTPISQAQANQRAGRAGRTAAGKCFRLYTEAAYQSEMLPSPIPDIQRQNLSTTILMLKAMGINDLLHFDFMDPPAVNTMLTALEELYALGALDDEGLLTRLGRKMADFPMEPSLAKFLISAVDLGCADEMLSIVAMLGLLNVFYRPKEKQAQADQKKAKFQDPQGDHLTLLNVYNAWKRSGNSTSWCFENFIQARSIQRARDVREQIARIMERHRYPMVSCGRETERVRRALCNGFFRNAARRETAAEAGLGGGGYKKLVGGAPVYIHPSSALLGKQAEWVVYHELVLTTREYMRWTTSIEPKWLVEAAPTFFRVAGTDGTLSRRRQQERIQPLYNKFAGEDDWRISAQRKARGRGGGGTWG
ncbi:P-loop containing nucleoside triphosphate hydrolase protein [Parachaetomium inaequale]|uniref:RNA helicase n=1 Tax=Parachaetomium inaequale TaxID=2588326 RepID=A0AAN6PGY5_9PEZI|nr:P-loop containing nucleoside triphosphate hydrolase protein [Parachaetomium inaequale]